MLNTSSFGNEEIASHHSLPSADTLTMSGYSTLNSPNSPISDLKLGFSSFSKPGSGKERSVRSRVCSLLRRDSSAGISTADPTKDKLRCTKRLRFAKPDGIVEELKSLNAKLKLQRNLSLKRLDELSIPPEIDSSLKSRPTTRPSSHVTPLHESALRSHCTSLEDAEVEDEAVSQLEQE